LGKKVIPDLTLETRCSPRENLTRKLNEIESFSLVGVQIIPNVYTFLNLKHGGLVVKTCVACAEDIKQEALLCRYCKVAQPKWDIGFTESSDVSEGVAQSYEINLARARNPKTPQQISEGLKGFANLTNLECLECLYKGTMGVTKSGETTAKRIVLWVLTFVLSILTGNLLIGLLLGVVAALVTQRVFIHPGICPNCGAILRKQFQQ
jgi:hypothetical protein